MFRPFQGVLAVLIKLLSNGSRFDIWCLLSFKACIEESLYLHLDASHYRKNFEDIIQFIEENYTPKDK